MYYQQTFFVLLNRLFSIIYRYQYILSACLVLSGLLGFSSVSSATSDSLSQQFESLNSSEFSPLSRNTGNIPKHITIGEHISISIVEGSYNKGDWTIPDQDAAYLTSAAIPGERGNIIVYGHNYWNIFGTLHMTQLGDIVRITTQANSQYEYRVIEVTRITTEQLEYLQPSTSEILTIYTCAGWLDSERFLVRAVPV